MNTTPPLAEFLHPQTELRAPQDVMRLERMGSSFPTRLSFMRSLIRLLHDQQAAVTRPVWDMDSDGYGRAVYSVDVSGHTYSLVAISSPLDEENRTDRVIAEAWDSAFVLFDGVPTAQDLDRIGRNAPLQEAGRFAPTELVLSRANKSVRLFNHVADRLSSGQQPDAEMLQSVGYLMRTTAVYGNGKFGIADRSRLLGRPEMLDPFRPELLTVWLIRAFTLDLVEHVARRRNPDAFVALAPTVRRYLGIGNSTGLGMAPFLVSHPVLINNWIQVRETALARVRAIESPTTSEREEVVRLLDRARNHVDAWDVADARQKDRIVTLRSELEEVSATLTTAYLDQPNPWDELVRLSDQWSIECQELLVSLLIEPHADLVDGLTHCMASTIEAQIEPRMQLREVQHHLRTDWRWALDLDFDDPEQCAQFWYVSEEKLEPRLGRRFEEPGAELEQPLDVARRVKALSAAVERYLEVPENQSDTVARFLMSEPGHRFAMRRVQTLVRHPYGEIRDNMIAETCLPIDMLRSKLSFFGASRFDPRSDRWTRITLYSGAPLFDTISDPGADDWWLPVLSHAE